MVNRVVITGMGPVTPIGIGVEEMWKSAIAGKCGIGKITAFDTADFRAKLAAQVNDFVPEKYIEKKEVRRMDRFCQFAIAAAQLCIDDSNIDLNSYNLDKFGVIIGSGIGGMYTIENEQTKLLSGGPRKVSPLMIPMIIPNMAGGQIAIKFGLRGVCSCSVTACTSGLSALGDAYRLIKHGYAERMLAGGAEATITPLSVAAFANLTALSCSEDPSRASIPFDAERNGFVMGEGAGVVLLERYDLAIARGAKIYAEIIGYGATGDAYHMTAPDPESTGAARAMKEAMEEAGIAPSQIDYINAHGTSTPANDVMETKAIKAAFEDCAKDVAISSTKSMTGHMLGAAGAVESIICVKAITDGFIPPTINYKVGDPECDLNYVPNVGINKKVKYALTNSFGFGGHNGSLLLGAVE